MGCDGDATPCYYCGMPADSIDHVLPQSAVAKVANSGLGIAESLTTAHTEYVHACRDCNGRLGKRIFQTLADRKRFIKTRLRRKYQSLLESPAWTEEELNNLGPELQRYVRQQQHLRYVVQARLRW